MRYTLIVYQQGGLTESTSFYELEPAQQYFEQQKCSLQPGEYILLKEKILGGRELLLNVCLGAEHLRQSKKVPPQEFSSEGTSFQSAS